MTLLAHLSFACSVPPRANARGTSVSHASLVKKQRKATSMALLTVHALRDSICALPGWIVRITRMSKHPLDDGDGINSAIKAFRDEVAAWLQLSSDRDRRVKFVGAQAPNPHPELPGWQGVKIEIFTRQACAHCGAPTVDDKWIGDGTSAEPRRKRNTVPNVRAQSHRGRARCVQRYLRQLR